MPTFQFFWIKISGTDKYVSEGYFPLGGIFRAERHFLLFKYQLAESRRQKTKENTIPRGKFRLVEKDLEGSKLKSHTCSIMTLF